MDSAPKQVPVPLPPYVRPPVRGQEYFSRFSRSKLYQLEREGHIRGISLYAEGGRRSGIKLFDLQSIFDYIERQAQKNSPEKQDAASGAASCGRKMNPKSPKMKFVT
jgi:hypothetical protein